MPQPVRRVLLTPHFERAFRVLPVPIRDIAAIRDRWFRSPRLKTHGLKGKLKGLCAYSVNREYRILLEFLAADEAL